MHHGPTGGDSGAEPEYSGALGIQMEQQWNMSVPIFGVGSSCAAHLKMIVDPQRSVSRGVFDNRDRCHSPFPVIEQLAAGRKIDQAKAEWDQCQSCQRQATAEPMTLLRFLI